MSDFPSLKIQRYSRRSRSFCVADMYVAFSRNSLENYPASKKPIHGLGFACAVQAVSLARKGWLGIGAPKQLRRGLMPALLPVYVWLSRNSCSGAAGIARTGLLIVRVHHDYFVFWYTSHRKRKYLRHCRGGDRLRVGTRVTSALAWFGQPIRRSDLASIKNQRSACRDAWLRYWEWTEGWTTNAQAFRHT